MELKLTLPVPISINSLYINEWGWNPKTRKREPTGAKILSKEGEKCKKLIQSSTVSQMESQEWNYGWTEDKNNFLYMDIIVYFNRRGRDADNLFKLLSDSLEKIVYDNDSRILPRVQKIMYDTKNPHIEVEFSEVGYIGIFNDGIEAASFEDKCRECTRYLNGRCSILVDSLAGTVREEIGEIKNPTCSVYKEKRNNK